MASVKMDNMIDKFHALTQKPVKYLAVQEDIKGDIQSLIKSLYDFTKSQEQSGKSKTNQALPEIIIKDFDEEQIWQQIELQNSQCWDHLVWEVANSISSKNNLTFPVNFIEHEVDEASNDDQMSFNDDDDSENVSPKQKNEKKSKIKAKKKESKENRKIKTSIVDDNFFKLQDMEKFLISEEKMEEKSKNVNKNKDEDEESVDMFEDIDSEGSEYEGGKEMMYADFFNDENGEYNDNKSDDDENGEYNENDDDEIDQDDNDENEIFEEDIVANKGKKVRFAELDSEKESEENQLNKLKSDKKVRFEQPDSNDSDSDDSTEEGNVSNNLITGNNEKDEKKSEFEMRQQRLRQQISKLEEKTLTEAPWQLKGEIDASKRPQNSLLEEVLDFDLTTRPPPTITEQTTITLEGLIKQRIKDKAWDDVVRKEKPVDDQLLFKKPEILDHSKSKLSLAQVYETEYLKQKQAQSGDVEEEKEPESHTEIRNAMTKLFAQLDALCHYHYTPKPPQADVKIVSNTPAISMEEVAPVATSDAALLAPEEVKRKRKGDLMSKEERTQTDKNRERRKKKMLQQKKGHVADVTNHKNTMKGHESNDKSLKTSKAFFQQLNDDSSSLIKTKKKYVKNK